MGKEFSDSRRRILLAMASMAGMGFIGLAHGQSAARPGMGRPAVASSPQIAAARPSSDTGAVSSSNTYRPRVIVVDPGHGGHHRGAQGRAGNRSVDEASMTMPIGLFLERHLQSDPMFAPRLTRRSDVYVGLRERTRLAEEFGGHLFISIHYNAAPNAAAAKTARGLEFYTWSPRAGDSVAARYLQALNNEEGPSSDLSRSSAAARPVLDKMLQDALEVQSLTSVRVARALEESFLRDSYFRRNYRGRKTERFKVLENYNMPSVLIEVAFLSHAEEARMAADPAFQQKVARYIYDGVVRYYEDSDPVFRAIRRSRLGAER
jgi:N-acetylmuramoyl-L-alanine amidase